MEPRTSSRSIRVGVLKNRSDGFRFRQGYDCRLSFVEARQQKLLDGAYLRQAAAFFFSISSSFGLLYDAQLDFLGRCYCTSKELVTPFLQPPDFILLGINVLVAADEIGQDLIRKPEPRIVHVLRDVFKHNTGILGSLALRGELAYASSMDYLTAGRGRRQAGPALILCSASREHGKELTASLGSLALLGQAGPALILCSASREHGKEFDASLGSLALLGELAGASSICYVTAGRGRRQAGPALILCSASREHGGVPSQGFLAVRGVQAGSPSRGRPGRFFSKK